MFKKVSGKRFLSILLAVFVVFASVPTVLAEYVDYTQKTVTDSNGNTYYYFTDGSQYIRNGGSNNEYMNVWADNAFFFMLTEPTQKFSFQQSLRLQCEWRLSGSSVCFNDIVYYTGQDLVGTMRIEGIPDGENKTATLINSNGLNVSWGVDTASGNANAQKVVDNAKSNNTYEEGKIPWGYEFEVSFINASGNSNYYWLGTSSFETSEPMEETFYYALSWYDEVSDMEKDSLTDRDSVTNQQVFATKLVVTDVRELIAEVEKIKNIINNPEGYTDEQIEQYQKYIDSIPEGMLEGTTYYTQEQVDTVYDYVTGGIDGFADTEEYMYYREKALELIKKDADGNYIHTDIYTNSSLSAFETAFKAVDIGAYFPYPASRQNEVDEATNKVKGTFSELAGVNTETHSSNGTTTDTVWETTDGIDVPSGDIDNDHTIFKFSNTSYKFVQVTDNQEFSFNQELTGRAKNVSYNLLGAVRPNFESFTFDADCDGTNCLLDENSTVTNNTTSFIERLDESSKTSTDGVTSFKGWTYNSRSGDTVHGFNITDGVLQQTLLTSDTQFMGSTTYHDFYGDATISFKGNGNEVDEKGNRISRESEIDASFYWKLTSSYDGTYYHAHIPVEILITDVRPLSDLYDELYKFSNFSVSVDERSAYTNESVENVKNTLATVPVDMVYGTSYYTQEEVNSYYNALLTAKNSLESTAKADYTELDSAIVNAEALLNGETVYTDATKTTLETAIAQAKAIERNLSADKQGIIDSAASDITSAISSLKVKADYTDYNKLKAELDEIINAGNNGSHTDEEWQSFVDSITSVDENLNKDLSEENQAVVDNAVEQLKNAKEVYDGRQTADYTALEDAISRAENILNDTETVYTDASKSELEKVCDSAKNLDRNLPISEQATVDAIVTELEAAISGVKEKADYTAFDEAIKAAEDALNSTDITYTSSTKQALENALNLKETIGRDLSIDEQSEIDSVTKTITDATKGLTEAADTSAYKDALENAKEIISGGNEDGRYDEEDWNKFTESVTEAENSVGENLEDIPESEQGKVDSATEGLTGATTELYNKRYIFVEFRNESNGLFASYRIQYKDGLTCNDLESIPAVPESDGLKKYIGWYYIDGKTMNLTDAITEDVALFCIEEEIKIVTDAESGAEIDETKDFYKGLKHGTTVEELLATLENDLGYITVKDKDGNIVNNDAVIATGMTVELVSRSDRTVKNEVVTVVVKGDVNGDGLVNDDDFNKSVDMCLKNTFYGETEGAYFAANDTDNDGVLDVIDLFNISNMRFGN